MSREQAERSSWSECLNSLILFNLKPSHLNINQEKDELSYTSFISVWVAILGCDCMSSFSCLASPNNNSGRNTVATFTIRGVYWTLFIIQHFGLFHERAWWAFWAGLPSIQWLGSSHAALLLMSSTQPSCLKMDPQNCTTALLLS